MRKRINNLKSREYEHASDRNALNKLEGTPGLETIVKKFNQYGIERILKIQYTGSNLKLGPNTIPEVYNLLLEACDILDIKEPPDLYVKWSYDINAFTAGVEKPIIVLNSGCVDLLGEEEILYILGHELGHIKSQHVLYHQIASILPILGEIIGSATLGIGALISTGLELALLHWHRMSEFSADRAGLLVCQDIDHASSALVKMSGIPLKYFDNINTQAFIEQAKAFDGYDFDTFDKIAKVLSTMWQDHPWTVMRTAELIKWIESGNYDDVMNRKSQSYLPFPPGYNGPSYCIYCGFRLSGQETFCPGCGKKLK